MSGAVPGTDQSINEIQGNDFGPGGTVNPGSQTVLDPIALKGYHATVYSGCARLIVQKITADPAVLELEFRFRPLGRRCGRTDPRTLQFRRHLHA